MSQLAFSNDEMAQLEAIFNQNGINLDNIQRDTLETANDEQRNNPSSSKS